MEPLLRLTLYEQLTRSGNVKIEKLLSQQYCEIMSGNTFQSARSIYSEYKLPKKQSGPTVWDWPISPCCVQTILTVWNFITINEAIKQRVYIYVAPSFGAAEICMIVLQKWLIDPATKNTITCYILPLHEPNKTNCLRELILTDVKVNIIRM